MTALPRELVTRLGKILGMLGSDYAGERAAAGLQATNLLRSAGLTWAEFVETATTAGGGAVIEREHKREAWQDQLDDCQDALERFSTWERGFLASLADRWSEPTAKQQAVLDRLHAKATRP